MTLIYCLQIILLILDTAPPASTSNAEKASTLEGTSAPTSVPVTAGILNQDLIVTESAKNLDDKQQIPPPEMRGCRMISIFLDSSATFITIFRILQK